MCSDGFSTSLSPSINLAAAEGSLPYLLASYPKGVGTRLRGYLSPGSLIEFYISAMIWLGEGTYDDLS